MKGILFLVFGFMILNAPAQDTMEQTMEKRARELHRVLGLSGKEDYKKFMTENYTKEFLEKPVKLNRVVSDSEGNSATTSSDNKPMDNLEAKTQMYAQLHEDFGGSKLESITRKDNKIEMKLNASGGLKGKFTLTFNREKPYLIEAMGVEADMQN